jgi:subtilase family serine protease
MEPVFTGTKSPLKKEPKMRVSGLIRSALVEIQYASGFYAAIAVLAGCSVSQPPIGSPGAQVHIPYWQATNSARAACSGSRIDQAQCDVLIETGEVRAATGWSAKELEAAYNLPTAKGKGQNVYVVDAYDNPNVANDVASYRSGMGLPNGTLNKYNQYGQKSNYPQGSPGWGIEIDLDVEMASASCPKCTIDLVEANSNAWADIEAAECEAVKLGATIVSNSYDGSGASESCYDVKGVTYLASSGDAGYGVYEPAGFPRVIAVGGTFLNSASGKRGYSETVWTDTGGGCTSAPKPKWQKDPDCNYRTANDVAAVAAGAAEYDSYDEGGWLTVDGTSISAPLVAGMFGLAGNSTKQDGGKMLWTLSKSAQEKDIYYISQGTNGQCGGTYLCTAGTMQFGIYSGPTGWGTPHGIGAL